MRRENRQRIARVALDVPLDSLFDFVANDIDEADIGRLVRVPFGKRTTMGVVVEVADHSDVDTAKLRAVEEVLRTVEPIARNDLAVARFCAEYYHHPLGQTLLGSLPPALRTARAAQILRSMEARYFAVTAEGAQVDLDRLPAKSVAQRGLLSALKAGPRAENELAAALPRFRPALRALLDKGWIATAQKPAETAQAPADPSPSSFELNEEQNAASAQILEALGRYQAFLLHGITGSGKTEVYLQSIAAALAARRQALVLVPEINLTPQLEQRFRARFPSASIVMLHSHMGERERLQAWLATQAGRVQIVLGTRLAVFAPLPSLGLVIVDEEHDPSFKQQEGLRYSARDVAVYRARQRGCPIVLGSATPSLESWSNAASSFDGSGSLKGAAETKAAQSRYRLLSLTHRAVPTSTLPAVYLLDLNREAAREGVAEGLLRQIEQRLKRGEQSLVFVNRRGYAPALVCQQCAWVPECSQCAARMVFHRADRRLVCHHCGHTSRVPARCGECGSADLAPLGEGTQRVEAALAAQFPDARIVRIDRDATRAKGSAQRLFDAAGRGEVDILVGTQMLAKGHDFPNLTLVGILNADASMFSADFRAPERLFAQLVQVAGRAGRAGLPGEVWIQTRFPNHPLYAAVQQQDFAAFADMQLAERNMLLMPPASHLVLLRVEGRKPGDALRFARGAVDLTRGHARDVTVFDAVPAALERKAGWERVQVMAQSRSRKALQNFIGEWRKAIAGAAPRAIRWTLDVDPLEV
jgi:primosomal protein N' (replication factor Y)